MTSEGELGSVRSAAVSFENRRQYMSIIKLLPWSNLITTSIAYVNSTTRHNSDPDMLYDSTITSLYNIIQFTLYLLYSSITHTLTDTKGQNYDLDMITLSCDILKLYLTTQYNIYKTTLLSSSYTTDTTMSKVYTDTPVYILFIHTLYSLNSNLSNLINFNLAGISSLVSSYEDLSVETSVVNLIEIVIAITFDLNLAFIYTINSTTNDSMDTKSHNYDQWPVYKHSTSDDNSSADKESISHISTAAMNKLLYPNSVNSNSDSRIKSKTKGNKNKLTNKATNTSNSNSSMSMMELCLNSFITNFTTTTQVKQSTSLSLMTRLIHRITISITSNNILVENDRINLLTWKEMLIKCIHHIHELYAIIINTIQTVYLTPYYTTNTDNTTTNSNTNTPSFPTSLPTSNEDVYTLSCLIILHADVTQMHTSITHHLRNTTLFTVYSHTITPPLPDTSTTSNIHVQLSEYIIILYKTLINTSTTNYTNTTTTITISNQQASIYALRMGGLYHLHCLLKLPLSLPLSLPLVQQPSSTIESNSENPYKKHKSNKYNDEQHYNDKNISYGQSNNSRNSNNISNSKDYKAIKSLFAYLTTLLTLPSSSTNQQSADRTTSRFEPLHLFNVADLTESCLQQLLLLICTNATNNNNNNTSNNDNTNNSTYTPLEPLLKFIIHFTPTSYSTRMKGHNYDPFTPLYHCQLSLLAVKTYTDVLLPRQQNEPETVLQMFTYLENIILSIINIYNTYQCHNTTTNTNTNNSSVESTVYNFISLVITICRSFSTSDASSGTGPKKGTKRKKTALDSYDTNTTTNINININNNSTDTRIITAAITERIIKLTITILSITPLPAYPHHNSDLSTLQMKIVTAICPLHEVLLGHSNPWIGTSVASICGLFSALWTILFRVSATTSNTTTTTTSTTNTNTTKSDNANNITNNNSITNICLNQFQYTSRLLKSLSNNKAIEKHIPYILVYFLHYFTSGGTGLTNGSGTNTGAGAGHGTGVSYPTPHTTTATSKIKIINNNILHMILPGIFTLFDKCKSKQRKLIYEMLSYEGRGLYDEIYKIYLDDYKFGTISAYD